MPRGDQVARLYRLVMDLARTKRGLPAALLARRHGLLPRTVYRDLHALEQAGFPIAQADGSRWKLVEGWEARIPFPLPLAQLLALHVARDLMAPLRGTRLARDFEEFHRRLTGEPPIPSGERQGTLFDRFRTILVTRSALAIDYTAHAAVLETLCRGCEKRTTVRCAYHVESRRELTRRLIDPYCLYYDPHLEALYVFAWCHLRNAMRTFAVHRFRQAALTAEHFEVPATFTPEGYLRRAFRIWRGEHAVRVRIAVDPEVAGWIAERRWHASQKLRRRAGGGCELELTVDGAQEIKRFVLQLGASAEVVEPAWLREEVTREHAAAARRGVGRARRGPRRAARRGVGAAAGGESVTSADRAARHSGWQAGEGGR
jgi:predicted DNA-binding transcriptional regulator YafY